MKTLLTASAAALFAAVAAPAASAAPYAANAASVPYAYVAGHEYASPSGFPRGVAYGVGYRGAGSLTGGPVGGLPSRN